MQYKLEKFGKFSDERGDLIVFLKKTELPRSKSIFGQIYFVTFNKKNIVRGNHYHKKWSEWFGIVQGKVLVVLRDMKTSEQTSFILDSEDNEYVRLMVGPNIAHSFKSISDYASLLNYADDEWSSEDTFTHILM